MLLKEFPDYFTAGDIANTVQGYMLSRMRGIIFDGVMEDACQLVAVRGYDLEGLSLENSAKLINDLLQRGFDMFIGKLWDERVTITPDNVLEILEDTQTIYIKKPVLPICVWLEVFS